MAETVWVLDSVYDRTATQLVTLLEMLFKHKQLTIQDVEVVVSALGQFKKRTALGFSDCLVLEIAHKAGHLPLGTFDRNPSKLEGTKRLE